MANMIAPHERFNNCAQHIAAPVFIPPPLHQACWVIVAALSRVVSAQSAATQLRGVGGGGGLFVTADAQPVISAATHKDAGKQKLREPQWFTHVDPPELLLLLLPPARSFCDFVGYRPQSVPETLAGVACADS